MSIRERNAGIDLTKAVAVFSVICVHFFLNTPFYREPLHGFMGAAAVTARTAFMVCVPLFLISTGYLMKNKTLCASYYLGVLNTVITYLLASIICIIWRCVQGDDSVQPLLSILNFSGCGYAWYVEMYLGLFVLIPFLNAAYNGLASKRARLVLVGTLVLMVALPQQLNWLVKVLPGWWSGSLFPVMYYYVGCYLRDYPVRLKPSRIVLFWSAWILASSAFNYYLIIITEENYFMLTSYVDWGSLENLVASVLCFVLFQTIKVPSPSTFAGRGIRVVSRCSLGIYLLSFIADSIIYPNFLSGFSFRSAFPFLPLVVLVVFLLSAISGYAVSTVSSYASRNLRACVQERLG